LVSLLDASGLASTFQGPGTFTVFAPTNAAFAKLPAPIVNWLNNTRQANRNALSSTLQFHVLGAIVNSTQVPAAPGANITTLCTTCLPALTATNTGTTVTISTTTGTLLATVVIANVVCTNGIVHVIDSVLVPSNKAIPTLDVVQTASAANLTSLVGALVATGLNNTLSIGGTSNSWTVFAPTNAAFVPVPSSYSSNLTTLARVLTYHVIVGRVYAANLPLNTNFSATTVNGQSITLLRTDAGVTIFTATGGVATVVAADVDSSNAVVHVINAVLVPAGLPAPTSGALQATSMTALATAAAAVLLSVAAAMRD